MNSDDITLGGIGKKQGQCVSGNAFLNQVKIEHLPIEFCFFQFQKSSK